MCVVRIVATEPTHTRRTCRLLCVFFACLALSRPPCLLRPFPQVTLLDKFMEAKQQSRRRRERHERAVAFPQNFEAGEYHSSAEREEKVVESTSSLGLESLLSEHWIMPRDSSHCPKRRLHYRQNGIPKTSAGSLESVNNLSRHQPGAPKVLHKSPLFPPLSRPLLSFGRSLNA